jgi:3D (Asp-Asp-Asp) domain-containing protein
LKVYSIFSGSAVIGAALLTSSLLFTASTSSAETLPSQDPKINSTETTAEAIAPVALEEELLSRGHLGERIAAEEAYVVPPTTYIATAYSLRGRTASGQIVSKGLIAADPRVLPLGSRVRLEAGAYSGEYLVPTPARWYAADASTSGRQAHARQCGLVAVLSSSPC